MGAGGLVYRVMAPQLAEARREASAATDRLVGAWRDGYQIPPGDQATATEADEPLPAPVQAFLEQWDDAGRAVWGRKARQLMAEGYQGEAIVRLMERGRETATEAVA